MSDTYWIRPSANQALWFVYGLVSTGGRKPKDREREKSERICQVCMTADGAKEWIKEQK